MNAIEKTKEILKGIDEDEAHTEDGWWETSGGVRFGADKLKEMLALVSQQQAEIEDLKVRLNPYKAITDTKIEPTVVSSAQYVEEAPYHPGYEDAAMRQEIKFHEPPKYVGCWTIGGNFSIFATKRPTDEQIQHTIDYFGWTWTDGSLEEQLKGRQ